MKDISDEKLWYTHNLPKTHPLLKKLVKARAQARIEDEELDECGLRLLAWEKTSKERQDALHRSCTEGRTNL